MAIKGAARRPRYIRGMECRRLLPLALCLSCSAPEPGEDPGALVDLTMHSSVGVLLDEIPAADRDRVAEALLAESDQVWRARATLQIEATAYRLTYRNFFVDGGQLPLPPREQWTLDLGVPERRTIDGHDLVVIDYTFTSTLLSAADQPGLAEPLLAEIGGVWDEAFVLPVDPELLLERTGYACMDEEDFPPHSVDTENARWFYDDTCEAGLAGCHVTEDPGVSCIEALQTNVGTVATVMHFERRPWDSARADEVRFAEQSPRGPQLRALTEGVEDNRIVYRYFPADACAIAEGCVDGPGWRRLLQFTASLHNVGDEDLVLGDVGPGSPIVEHGMVSFSECHGHMHFNHYGDFTFGDGAQELGSKRAFCVASTSRYSNTELSPLVHDYDCHYQGTAAGWGDDYVAGLDCQWIDITSVEGPVTTSLDFEVNPDGFLCEGELLRDAEGEPMFEPTEFTNEQGEIESRFACEPREDASADNLATTQVEVPAEGGLISEPCTRGQLGPKRSCGLIQRNIAASCMPGETVTLSCSVGADAPAQVLRVCETSAVLGHAIPCTHREALASATIGQTPVDVVFACPEARDADEPGGAYSSFAGSVITSDPVAPITCM
jgi:hypothetical protein